MDGLEVAEGVVVSVHGHFGRNWASLRLTVVAFKHTLRRSVETQDRRQMHGKESCDSRRENELIMGRCILIDIYKGEYEVKGKFCGKPFKEG